MKTCLDVRQEECVETAPPAAQDDSPQPLTHTHTLTGDFLQLVHEPVLHFGEDLVVLAGARAGQAGGVGAGRHRGGGGGLGRRRRQRFPSTLAHGGDCWEGQADAAGEGRSQGGVSRGGPTQLPLEETRVFTEIRTQ